MEQDTTLLWDWYCCILLSVFLRYQLSACLSICLFVCLFVWWQEEPYLGVSVGCLCVTSIPTALQTQTAPNKSLEYLHGNSNCMNKCVSQVGKNMDSYEYYQWSSHIWICCISTSLSFEYQCKQCWLSTHIDILHNYLNTALQSCKIRLYLPMCALPCLNFTAVQH